MNCITQASGVCENVCPSLGVPYIHELTPRTRDGKSERIVCCEKIAHVWERKKAQVEKY